MNVILFSFASDWWRGWCEFSGPITEQSLEKPKQITVDGQLKIIQNMCGPKVVWPLLQ